jgi:hypothetical protein
MPGLDDIVRVVITRGSKTVSRAGFGTPMILGLHTRFAERIRFYSSLAAVAGDGFLTSDSEYKAAAAMFAQEIKPSKIAIGRRTAAVAQVVTYTPTVLNSTLYTVTINGTLHSYTSDGTATDAEIVAGLIAAINGGAQAAKVTASGTTTLIITSDNAGESFTYAASSNLAGVLTTPNNGVQEDIQAVIEASDDWYCLILTSRTDLDIRLAAAKIETLKKIQIACSDDSNVKGASSSDIGSVLELAAYLRTALLYSADQANYPEAAWAATRLPLDPGSETWKFATLSGITPDALTDNEVSNLEGKKVNFYNTIAGLSIVQNGQVSGNEWIDVIRGIDWLEARMKERVFSRLVNSPKVPYTDLGVAVIEADVRAQLLEGVRVGLLAADPEFEVNVPKVADIDPADRAARILPDVSFNATLAGAIHEVEISGVVSV